MGENAPKKDSKCLTGGLIFILMGIPGAIALEVPVVFDKMMALVATVAFSALFLYVLFAWVLIAMGAYLVFIYVSTDKQTPTESSPESAE